MNLMDEAETLVLHQFSGSPKLLGLIRTLVKPFQDILDDIEQLNHGRYIDQAIGHRLDVLGAIVGQSRRGLSDEDYRAWIKVGIRLNQGSGSSEDIFAILAIIYHPKPSVLSMREYTSGDVFFFFFTLPKAPFTALVNIVRSATPVTTTCHFIRADAEPSLRFDIMPFEGSKWADFYEEKL
jgi:hypothetical protein